MSRVDMNNEEVREDIILGLCSSMIEAARQWIKKKYPNIDASDYACSMCSAACGIIGVMAGASIKPDKIEEYVQITASTLRTVITKTVNNEN